MATCMAMGQAAGTAAAMLSQKGTITRNINIPALRRELLKQGQYLLRTNQKAGIDKTLILKRTTGSGEKAAHHNPFAQ
jgi:hypothetical protein